MNPHGSMPMVPPHRPFPVSMDNFTIYVALACAVLAFVLYLVRTLWLTDKASDSGVGRAARVLCYISAISVSSAFLYLLQCTMSGARYDIAYISDHSSVFDSLMYRISSLWAGQEGSLLLWVVLAAVVGAFLARGTRGVGDRARTSAAAPALMSFWCSVQSFLMVLLVLQDPFRKLAQIDPNSTGSGMNPLLKNPWMVIHPPVVFVAYALLLVPAALALQALVDRDKTRWVGRCMPWALAGWVAMTAGLVLGMVWSYEVLGWGGYWNWDPVENASLVPWLLSTALVHGLVLQRQRGRMAHWNIALAFLTFLSVLYATYLTRSGILSDAVSVHSFTGDENFRHTPFYQLLKWAPILYGALAAGLLGARWKSLSTPAKPARVDSRDSAIGIGVVVLCLLAIVVVVGTNYTVFNREIARLFRLGHPETLKPIFYTVMSVPLATVAILLISLSPLVSWGGGPSARGSRAMHIVIAALAVAAGVSAVLSRGAPGVSLMAAALLVACAVVAVMCSVIGGWNTSLRRSGAYVAHVGVALMIIGIVSSNAGRHAVVDLTNGGKAANALGYRIGYIGREPIAADAEAVRIRIERGGKRFEAPLPVVRSSLFRPYIRSGAWGDLYVSAEELKGTIVNPSMTMGETGWVAHPWPIPGSKSTLALLGMQVEQHLATLQYERPGMEPVRLDISAGKPASVDGYTLTFKGYTSSGESNMMKMTAGVNVGIEGHGHEDVAIVRISTKPYIWTLWLGTILIMLGGTLAVFRRRAAKDATE